MSGLKRPAGSEPSTSAPPEKKRERERDGGGGGGEEGGRTTVETVIKVGGVSSTEELDVRALQVRNRKLAETLDQRQLIEDELRETIERLERRQATDDASLLILNRYWSQFDENIRLIIHRYDLDSELSDLLSDRKALDPSERKSLEPSDPEPDSDSNPERGSVREREREERGEGRERRRGQRRGGALAPLSFLATLASSSSDEMEAALQERVESSHRLTERVLEICDSFHSATMRLGGDIADSDRFPDAVRELNSLLSRENQRLEQLRDSLQEKHSSLSSQFSVLGMQVEADRRVSELQSRIEDLQWDIDSLSDVSPLSFEEMNSDLEENRELAENRLSELQKLKQDLHQINSENSNMKVQLVSKAQVVVKECSEYRCLQSQFSVLYNESLQHKAQLDEARSRLQGTRGIRLRQLDHMEHDELSLQKKLRTEVIQLEDTLAQVRKEYEMLRIEFEQTLAANEQAGPINREMRHLISSLQNHNQHMKGEVQKYKRRLRDAHTELSQARAQRGSALLQPQSSMELDLKDDTSCSPLTLTPSTSCDLSMKAEPDSGPRSGDLIPSLSCLSPGLVGTATVKAEPVLEGEGPVQGGGSVVKEEERERGMGKGGGVGVKEERERPHSQSEEPDRAGGGAKPSRKEQEQLKVVRAELKKAQESQKEMKLLLDMYRSAPKEQRDKVQLMAAESFWKAEIEALSQRLRELEERERREGKKMADEDALRKMRSVEEQREHLTKKLSIAKQVRLFCLSLQGRE
ncbi:E3 ubiquitin-protein ligase BRE1A-like [Polyodon spathula]|uniref:E3 ubiquitin-protein ligase BRE1A-like n=1 Tax=Polyodon spathula TaxID=7913 RepID=UPI001B7F09AC|nr:E3 ubiquitin-protein ligase BRE1A-like [Polyodon spathula]